MIVCYLLKICSKSESVDSMFGLINVQGVKIKVTEREWAMGILYFLLAFENLSEFD